MGVTENGRYAWAAAGIGLGLAAAAIAWPRLRSREDLSGQTVLITGGSRGLGLALAREFADQGCRIAICARDHDQLQRAAQMLQDEGIACVAVVCDVTDVAQVNCMVRKVKAQLGPIDILVNNAGEIIVAPLENTTIADFERALDVMFWGVVHTSLAVLPDMKQRGAGKIATIASIGGKVSVPHLTAYSCAKAAAVAFCEGLHAELEPYGIQVTTIAPGLMRTGSHVNATFKGQQAREAKWFSAAATLPGISMSAERAARQTVDAIRTGRSVKVLSTQADLLARVQGAFPGLVPDILAKAARLLPNPTADTETEIRGRDLQHEQGRLFRAITTLGRSAGARLNQEA